MSKSKENKAYKVKPGDKKEDTAKSRAESFLKQHPEVLYNAEDLFHNRNDKTIIEEKVPRGDLGVDSIMPMDQYELEDADYKAILKYANKIIDKIIKEYDDTVAQEDALTKAIATFDEGKYANKVNATTYNYLLDHMKK